MADPRVKQLKIRTGVVKRLAKEKLYYEKEAQKEQERYDTFKSEGADEYKLRKQQEVINESKAMGPETKKRLMNANDDLKAFLEAEADLGETEEYKEAQKNTEEAEKVLAESD